MVYYYFSSEYSIGRVFRKIAEKLIRIKVQPKTNKTDLEILHISKDINKIIINKDNLSKYKPIDDTKENIERRISECVFSSGFTFPEGAVFGVFPEEVVVYTGEGKSYKKISLNSLFNMIFTNIVVFDTNLFMRNIITNYAMRLVRNKVMKSTVFIPPIIIWELENMSKREKKGIGGNRDTRLAKSAFKDITFLQDVCKEFITYSKTYSISDFALVKEVLSKGETDKVIRNEILRLQEEGKYKKRFVLITSDSFNCLCATAEGIETCFIPKLEIQNEYIANTTLNPTDRLGSLIRELAEDFYVISIPTKIGEIKIFGDWVGKRPSEWLSGRIMLEIEDKYDKKYKELLKSLKIPITDFY